MSVTLRSEGAGPDGHIISQLREEHRALEQRLDELNKLVYLTPKERLERKKIQKLKLSKKDQVLRLSQENLPVS